MSDPISDRYLQDARQVAESNPSADIDHSPVRPTLSGNATRAEGRAQDIRRYRKQIKKLQQKKEALMKFKDEGKIGFALGKLNKKIRFFRDMIDRTLRVGKRDYPEIYDDVQSVIVDLSASYNNSQIAKKCGVSRSVISHLHAGSHREVSKHTARNVYEVLIGVKRRGS